MKISKNLFFFSPSLSGFLPRKRYRNAAETCHDPTRFGWIVIDRKLWTEDRIQRGERRNNYSMTEYAYRTGW